MSFIHPDFIGYCAAILTTLAFVPQVWLTVRTRDVSGISLWLVYGVLQHSWPIVIANAVTLMLALVVLTMRLRYGACAVPARRQG